MDDLVKRLRMACVADCKCSIQEAASASERLSARIAELEKEKSDFHMQYRMKCDEETKRLELRIAALESGQPVEVRGEQWQLVPVNPGEKMIIAGDKFMESTSDLGNAWSAMLTASAQEMKKP